ncbi:MAG: DUF3108 domain-containing protein [Daejeonella sp.]
MKKITATFILLLSVTGLLFSQSLSNVSEPVFKTGEELSYRFRYGFITAAEATLKVSESNIKFDNKPIFHLTAEGKTSGTFNIFYRVHNRYDSYIDRDDLMPYLYTENIREANYRRTDKARFYQKDKKVVANKGTFKGGSQTFDIVSAYYFARNLDVSKLKKGDKFNLDYFLKDEIATMEIKYVGKEMVRSELGNVRCLKFSPSIQPGRIFRKDSKLYLWITDDGNRIPVKAQVEILVGSVTMELTNASGLKYPFTAAK